MLRRRIANELLGPKDERRRLALTLLTFGFKNGPPRDADLMFYRRVLGLLDFLLPAYLAEGKSHLTIAIGCTGGRHRSITVANRIGRHLADRDDIAVRVTHRDTRVD